MSVLGDRTSCKMVWECKDASVARFLDDTDISELRVVSKDWRDAVDATLTRLRPVSLRCPHLSSRLLPGLKSLLLDHPKLTFLQPQHLQECGSLTQLTQLHLGGQACFSLRAQHLSWVSSLTRLHDLQLRGCTKVRLSVVSAWHTLQQLQSLTLIGLSFKAADAPHLTAFLAAGLAATLTSLVLGDQQGLSFLSDAALQGLGDLLSPSCSLRVLDLSGCIELTDAGIEQLRGLGWSLHTLQLHNCMKVGAEAAHLIGSTFSHLTTLNLRGCCQLSDASLAAVLAGPVCLHLRQLNLQSCSSITGSCIPANASKLARLAELNLAYCSALQPLHLTALCRAPGLRRLNLTGCAAISGPEVLSSVLSRLAQLTQLDAGSWTVRGELVTMTSYDETQAQGLQAASCSSSTQEMLDGYGSSGSSSSSNSGSSQVSSSSGDDGGELPTGCSSSGSSRSQRLLPPKLQSLKLAELNCSESLFKGLVTQLPRTLTSLDLSGCRVSGAGVQGPWLQALQGLSNLQVLNLSGTTGGLLAADMAFLGALGSLAKVQIDHIHAGVLAAVPAIAAGAAVQSQQTTISTMQGASPAATPAAMPTAAAAAAAAGAAQHDRCGTSSTALALSTVHMPGTNPSSSGCCILTSSSSSSSIGSSQMLSADPSIGPSSSCPSNSTCTVIIDSPLTVYQHPDQASQQQQQQPSARASVAALLLGRASTLAGCQVEPCSQGLGSESSKAQYPDLPAMEPLELGNSIATNPLEHSTAAAAAEMTAEGAEQQRLGSSRSSSNDNSNSSSSVRRTLFAHTAFTADQNAAAPTHNGGDVQQLCELHPQQQQQQKVLEVIQCLQPWFNLSRSVQELSVSFSPGLCDAELASLGGLTGLRTCDLLACHSFTGSGFSSWSGLSSLTHLSLTGCSGLTDSGLAAVAGSLGGQLQELQLPGCRGVSDEGVAKLAVMTGLRTLNLSSNRALSGRCLRQLFPALCRLRSLSLALCGGLEDEGAAHLALAPCLHNLDLHCCWRLTDAGTHSVLSSSSSLRQVNVDGCPRLTLAACPHDWVALDSLVGGSEMKSSGSGGSTHKRPGLLVRVPQ